jgi:alkylated DNA repair dioxygenase AlkB
VQGFPPALKGFQYRAELIVPSEENDLLDAIGKLALKEAPYRQFRAKRRIVLFEPVPDFLAPLRDKVAAWAGIPSARVVHALVTEYRPGTQLGWHRDSPEYGELAGVSLGGHCRMRLRPYPPKKGDRKSVLSMDLAPRSAYSMREEARWGWQHSIAPTAMLRYSVTFRTLREQMLHPRKNGYYRQ